MHVLGAASVILGAAIHIVDSSISGFGVMALAGKTASWADLLAFAQRAEALGFDSLWVPDHLLLTWQEQRRGIWECWSLLAALAAVTSHVKLGRAGAGAEPDGREGTPDQHAQG
jgi:Luciferase-like monooxygenase